MADDDRGPLAESAEHTDVVGNVRQDPVGGNVNGLGRSPIPAHVDRDGPESRLGKHRELVTP